MAGSVNKVILIGNLGADPDVRTMQSGGRVCNLSVATSESWKDKNSGERQERTQWHRVVVFNENIVGVCEKFLKKGSKVYLEGQLETRKYTDNSGAEKYTTEVVLRPYRGELTMLDGKSGSGSGAFNDNDMGGYDSAPAMASSGGKVVNLSIATSESWKDKNSGERQERTQWHRVVIFNDNLATVAERYLKKGAKVYIEGQLETRKYTDKDGQEKYTTEVVLRPYRGELTMLDSRSGGGSGFGGANDMGGGADYGSPAPARAASGGGARIDDMDDEIPF